MKQLPFPARVVRSPSLRRKGSVAMSQAPPILVLMLSFSFLVFMMLYDPFETLIPVPIYTKKLSSKNQTKSDRDENVLTVKGNLTYQELNNLVFRPFGFEIVEKISPFPKLRHLEQPTCEKVFMDWLSIAKMYNESLRPPKTILENLKSAFLMNGFAGMESRYFDQRSANRHAVWSAKEIERRVNSERINAWYPGFGEAVYYATRYYNVSGMTGLVIGSQSPWVEALCLRNGAKKVITVEYTRIKTDHPKLGYYHPIEMAKNWSLYHEKFEFAVSFSSIEHSGLGRYGDPIDPIGDLREMQKVSFLRKEIEAQIWCQLKPGGLLFLGLPIGLDGLVFNAHRVYGRIRLAMMLTGFDLLDTFYGQSPKPTLIGLTDLYKERFDREQWLLVLRKRQ